MFNLYFQVLSNVAPAKPIRKLPEAERKALLSQETPCSTLDRSPPHTSLCVETSFTTNPGDVEMEECNSMEFLQESGYAPSDNNSLSWDYTEGQNDVKTRARAVDREARQEKSQSMPVSNGQPIDKPRPHLKLDLGSSMEDWLGSNAPLATPESLSDTSSLDSSRNSWRGSQRSGRKVVGLPKMEPILQSPLRHVKSEGYHYFMKAPSPVAYEDSPEHEQFDALSSTLNIPVAQSTPMKNTVTTKAEVSPPHRQDKRANHKLEFTGDDTYISPESSLIDAGDFLTDSVLESVNSPLVQPQDISSFDMTAEEQRITDKMNVLENDNNYKLAFGDDSVLSGANSGSPYVRHSPECEHHQFVYDSQVGHYSHAGRGYPHGGYMGHCPSCDASPTSSLPKLSSPVDLLGDLNTDSCSPTVENCSVGNNEKIDFKERLVLRKESMDIFDPNTNTIEPCLINVDDNNYTNSVQDMNLLNQQQTNNLVDSSPNHVIDMDSQQEPISPGDKKEPIQASPVSGEEDSVTNCHTALLVTESEV